MWLKKAFFVFIVRLFQPHNWLKKRESDKTLSLCFNGTFHVFNFIVTYLSLLQFAPWIVDRPHCGCWGHKGTMDLLKVAAMKKARCRWAPPPTSTLILHGCAFSHWLNQWQETKGQLLFFSFSFLKTFFASWKYKPVRGKWPLTSPFLVSSLYPGMMWGLWQRSLECVTLNVSDVIV